MKRVLALALLCLSLAGCANCDANAHNEEQKGRCWFFTSDW
jgi:hypothetical protein